MMKKHSNAKAKTDNTASQAKQYEDNIQEKRKKRSNVCSAGKHSKKYISANYLNTIDDSL
jgi:hypothetical protein